ncbi:phosphonate utilization associated putative membrane protein [Phaeobacter sp. CECT 5382]|uniref:DMT family transporter n=1 Tax=Rhodobacterales TaxID=204455 RepID=UPI0006DB822C|nr:DMT family transporter [Phaeobacter sp. CECT 5382]CUH89007.1 phosphonate utilization associated putative membrane protein [Phaeobacter sp. CECT 5382]
MNNLNGILFVIASMAAFTMEDMFIKRLSGEIPVGQILIMLGFGSGAVFAAVALYKGDNLFAPAAWRGAAILRTLSEAVGAMAFASALAVVDISTVAAVFQALPLVITMGAALFLGEQVGWRRWSAICVGFAGVLLIVRPGLDGFDPSVLLVLFAVLAIAARDLLTRLVDTTVSSAVVSFQAFASLIAAGGLLLAFTPGEATAIDGRQALMMLGGIAFGVAGYYAIVVATRIGDASAITPFRYSRLLFSILVGVLVFGERPDALTLAGATLIIGSGLYTFVRERRLVRRAQRQARDIASGQAAA